jgi:hypothetical protein
MLEVSRHDADHLHALAVDLQRAPDEARIRAETISPHSFAQHDHVVRTRAVLFVREDTTERRRYTERREEVAGDQQALETLGRLSVADQNRRRSIERDHLAEDLVALAESDEVGGRVRPAVGENRRAEHLDQSFRLRIREWTEEVGVEHAEHRRVGPDAECQGDDGHGSESWSAAERPRRIAQILEEIVDHSDRVGRGSTMKRW